VDAAPHFSDVLINLEAFLVKNGLIEEGTKKRLKRFCWCSDGPWDIRDFFVKQCFISQVGTRKFSTLQSLSSPFLSSQSRSKCPRGFKAMCSTYV